MKKIVCLALTLCLLLCACCAWAQAFVIDFDKLDNWENQNHSDPEGAWSWWSKMYNSLEIHKSGEYTIRNMHGGGGEPYPASIVIFGDRADNVTLNLENVKLSGYNSAPVQNGIYGSSTLNMYLDRETELSHGGGLVIESSVKDYEEEGEVVVNVSGEGSIKGYSGVVVPAKSTESADKNCNVTLNISGVKIDVDSIAVLAEADGSVEVNVTGGAVLEAGQGGVVVTSGTEPGVVTLGDNVTVQGGERYGAVKISGNNGKLYIDGKNHPGLMLLAGASLNDAEQIGIYESLEDVYGIDKVKNAKYIATRIEYEQAADLPQTGDSSSLALWGALLATACAGMMVARKREA